LKGSSIIEGDGEGFHKQIKRFIAAIILINLAGKQFGMVLLT